MSRVDIRNVSKRYGATVALNDINLTFEDGEFFGLLGPSGSGKTTLLRSIAGFVTPDAGHIEFDGASVETIPVHKRGIGMVFQSYALFPHLSIYNNIAFGLDVRARSKSVIRKRVDHMLAMVRLPNVGDRKPRQLSGGQQQRVALARALITEPKVLLLDEPLGALDRQLRQQMQVELREIQNESGVTTIFVTHDQEEALTLSDRIAIIDKGAIVQKGAPRDVYENPVNVFAAHFLGDANVLRGQADGHNLTLNDGTVVKTVTVSKGTVIVRPEKITVTERNNTLAVTSDNTRNALTGVIRQVVFSGASVSYRIAAPVLGEVDCMAFSQNASGGILPIGTPVVASWSAEHTIVVEE